MNTFTIDASNWFNSDPINPSEGESKFYLIYVFQMLCAGCVYRGLPEVSNIYREFNPKDLQVIGLHSVFENHAAMKTECLKVFINEFRIDYPVAEDKHEPGNILPNTMQRYQFRGTPTYLLLDSNGGILSHSFGTPPGSGLRQQIFESMKKVS